MAKVYLICGKLCCGKTTYAQNLRVQQQGVLLSVDELMLTLFGQHCGDMHDEYAQRTKQYLLSKALQLIECGISVILDWGVWTKAGRDEIKNFFVCREIPFEMHYLDVENTVWQERLEKRNREVLAGICEAYYVDKNLAAKFLARFEEPDRHEMDIWIKQEDNYG